MRLINLKEGKKDETYTVDYPGYLNLLQQAAFLSFSRPPRDLSHLPLVESLLALVAIFKEATRARGQSVMLYEEPDLSAGPLVDQQLIKALNEKVQKDAQYPIPEGFIKVTEKTASYSYRIPAAIASHLPESKVVAAELLDSLMNQALGFHFLEPLVTFSESVKVRPAMQAPKPPPAEALAHMSRVKKAALLTPDGRKGEAKSLEPVAEEQEFFRPKLNLALKLEVSQAPLADRGHVLLVAEVLEEMLTFLEDKEGQVIPAGQHLPPRPRKAPGKTLNEAKKQKEEE